MNGEWSSNVHSECGKATPQSTHCLHCCFRGTLCVMYWVGPWQIRLIICNFNRKRACALSRKIIPDHWASLYPRDRAAIRVLLSQCPVTSAIITSRYSSSGSLPELDWMTPTYDVVNFTAKKSGKFLAPSPNSHLPETSALMVGCLLSALSVLRG